MEVKRIPEVQKFPLPQKEKKKKKKQVGNFIKVFEEVVNADREEVKGRESKG